MRGRDSRTHCSAREVVVEMRVRHAVRKTAFRRCSRAMCTAERFRFSALKALVPKLDPKFRSAGPKGTPSPELDGKPSTWRNS